MKATSFATHTTFPNKSEKKERKKERKNYTFMLERRTGDSKKDVGLSPGGIVIQGDLEIGSFAGDNSLYLAPMVAPAAALELWHSPA